MSELILMQGLPASGKSTACKRWLTEDPSLLRARVSRDDLRESLFGGTGVLPFAQEQHITDVQQDTVRKLLKRGYDVVVDDLNLRRRWVVGWAEIALQQQVNLDIWRIETPAYQCEGRDHSRGLLGQRAVGREAIRALAAKFPISRWPEKDDVLAAAASKAQVTDGDWRAYTPRPGTPRAVLVDLDGTVALKDRADGSRGWHEYDRVGEDLPNHRVIEMINFLHADGNQEIIFLSGRKDSCHIQTRVWLERHIGEWTTDAWLFMRKADDNRSDDIVKHELFDQFVRDQYNVVGVFDDRDRVVAMWRAIGLQVYQVAPGNF